MPVYRLDVLPLVNSTTLTQSVSAARDRWAWTLKMLDQIRNAPQEYLAGLRLELDSLYFTAALVNQRIYDFLRAGGYGTERAVEIAGFQEATEAFERQLQKTQLAWNDWLNWKTGKPFSPTLAGGLGVVITGYGDAFETMPAPAAPAATASMLETLTEPKDLSAVWLFAGLTAGLWVLSKALRG